MLQTGLFVFTENIAAQQCVFCKNKLGKPGFTF